MRMIALIILLAALASPGAAQETVPVETTVRPQEIIPANTDIRPQLPEPKFATSAHAYAVTVYEFAGYDAEADPPFILEPVREVETELGAQAYAEFKWNPGYTVVEYCRAVPRPDGLYVLPQTRAERLQGSCMVYGYVAATPRSWHEFLVPVADTVKKIAKKPVKKGPVRRKPPRRRR